MTRPRLFAWLLHLYPPAVRERMGRAILGTVEDRLAAARASRGRRGWLIVALVEAGGLIHAGLAERTALRRDRRHSAGSLRHVRMPSRWNGIFHDVRHAIANLRRAPVFAAAAVVTLAIGIGGNTAIFSVVHAIVISPLPYPESHRLVWVDHGASGIGVADGLGITDGIYAHYRQRETTLEEIAAFQSTDLALTGDGDPMRIHGAAVTWTLAPTLGVTPEHGRWLTEADRDDGQPVVVLGFDLWQRRYGGDPAVVGQTIQLAGVNREVVGIMARGFAFPDPTTAFWIPRAIDARTPLGGFNCLSIARLAPGATVATAEADLQAAIASLAEVYPGPLARGYLDDAHVTPRLTTLKDHVVGHVARGLWILLATMGLVLVIVCANVANLFLVRAESRRREVAVRAALGATRGDLIRLFLAESTVLTVAGAVTGILVAAVGLNALVANGPQYLPRLESVRLDGSALAFALAVSALASTMFGVAPLGHRMTSLSETLRSGGRGSTAGRSAFRVRHLLAGGQVAAAAVLLTAAGLMAGSYWRLLRVDPGFSAERALTFEIALPPTRYPSRDEAAAFQQRALDALRALPGVSSAGFVSCLPLDGWCWGDPLSVDGRIVPEGTIPPVVAMRVASESYFETAGIPILMGRALERSDQEQQTNAVVVSRRLADRYFPDGNVLGQRVTVGEPTAETSWFTIVGVAGDVPAVTLRRAADPIIYYPMRVRGGGVPPTHRMTAVLRTTIPPADLVPSARALLAGMDPNLPLANVRTLNALLAEATAETAFTMIVIGIAALMALLLSVVGVYGVVAYVVTQRQNEMGVRAALGATTSDIKRLVVRQSLAMSVSGVVVGLGAAAIGSQVMRSLLFGIAPGDVRTYAGVAVVLVGAAWLAGQGPARSAAATDPANAMRAD